MSLTKITLWGFNEYADKKLMDFLPEVLPEGTFNAELDRKSVV